MPELLANVTLSRVFAAWFPNFMEPEPLMVQVPPWIVPPSEGPVTTRFEGETPAESIRAESVSTALISNSPVAPQATDGRHSLEKETGT